MQCKPAMKIVLISSAVWISSLLVPGVLSADGDVSSTCATGDTCTDGDSYCDTSDTAAKKCRCRSGFVPEGAVCARGWGRPCDRGMCLDNGVCTAASICGCDTSKNLSPSANGENCDCATDYALKRDNTCGLKIGKNCTNDASCIDDAVCTDVGGTRKCTCDTSKHFGTATDGASICSCASGYVQKADQSCGVVIGENCTESAACIDNAVCNATSLCQCDTSKNFAEGSPGDQACSCEANHFKRADKTCGLVIGQNCTASGTPCVDNAVCDAETSTCQCDHAKFFSAGTAGDTSCTCNTSISVPKADGSCGLKVGQSCLLSSAAKACGPHATCDTTSYLCSCEGGVSKQNTDGTCTKSHAPSAGTSFSLLTSALFVASRLLA